MLTGAGPRRDADVSPRTALPGIYEQTPPEPSPGDDRSSKGYRGAEEQMLLMSVMFVGCAPGETTASDAPGAPAAAAPAARKVDTEALRTALDAKQVPVLVDVRTPAEYAAGHVPGAVNIPVHELGKRVAEIEPYKGGEVWLICEVGGRSASAAKQLAALGFQTVDVTDGTAGWRRHSYPVE